MQPAVRTEAIRVNLEVLLRDFLPTIVSDFDADDQACGKLSEQIADLAARRRLVEERRDALRAVRDNTATLAMMMGATREQLAEVVGQVLADLLFTKVEF